MTRSNPLVSIIIPMHNAEATIGLAIKSALAQFYNPCEIIVVDDGSDDASVRIVERFTDRIKLIKSSKGNAAVSRNIGLEESNGHWIQFLDADDFLFRDKILEQISLLSKNPNAQMVSGKWGTFTGSPSKTVFQRNSLFKPLTSRRWIINSWKNQDMIQTNAWLVSKFLINKQGDWNESLTVDDDGEFFCRMIMGTEKIPFAAKSKSAWRVGHENRLSQCKSKEGMTSAYRSAISQANLVSRYFHDFKMRQCIADRLAARSFEVYLYDQDLGEILWKEAMKYAEPSFKFEAGPLFEYAKGILGWRRARRLQGLSYQSRDFMSNLFK